MGYTVLVVGEFKLLVSIRQQGFAGIFHGIACSCIFQHFGIIMLVTKSNQVLAIDIEDMEQLLEGEGLVNTFRATLKDIERTAPGIDGEFMLIKGIHLFS